MNELIHGAINKREDNLHPINYLIFMVSPCLELSRHPTLFLINIIIILNNYFRLIFNLETTSVCVSERKRNKSLKRPSRPKIATKNVIQPNSTQLSII